MTLRREPCGGAARAEHNLGGVLQTVAEAARPLGRKLEVARPGEWWDHKLAPLLGVAYATALYAGAALTDLAATLILVLVALAPGAVYVSVLNDLSDLEADRRVGKRNRLEGRSPVIGFVLMATAIAIGFGVACAAWLDDPLTLAFYGAAWLSFTAYSAPPLRLKERGLAGALADAAGAHLFPCLFAASAVLDAAGEGVDGTWLAVVGAWSFALGIRGALLHQFTDAASDVRGGIRTFAVARPRAARILGAYLAFPIELCALVGLVVLAGAWPAIVLLVFYAARERRRSRKWASSLVAVVPTERYRVALQGYYVSLFPIGILAAAVVHHPEDVLVLGVHVALFPLTIVGLFRDAA